MKVFQFLFVFSFTIIFSLFFSGSTAEAQELYQSYQGTYKGEVLEILDERQQEIAGTETDQIIQTLRTEILEGPQESDIVIMENDFTVLEEGDTFFFNHDIYFDGREAYAVVNVDRTGSLILLVSLFVLVVVLFGGWQGVRSILALTGSFLAIFYVLLPAVLNGWNPLFTSILVASAVLFVAIFLTHGFNRESVVAYSGTMFAVSVTSLFALFAVSISRLNGFAEEEAVYLNLNTGGEIDFTALLLGAIIIGVLGVLDDIAVTQAAVVSELYDSNPKMKMREVFRKALRVGREHVGALVNTLVLAYAGAALPVILYFYSATSTFEMSVNSEIFATEIVRSVVGSIGLILTVPVVTFLAVFFLKGHHPKKKKAKTHNHSHET